MGLKEKLNLGNPDGWAGKIIQGVVIAGLLLVFQDYLQRRLWVFQQTRSIYILTQEKQLKIANDFSYYTSIVEKILSNNQNIAEQNTEITKARIQITKNLDDLNSITQDEDITKDFSGNLDKLHKKLIDYCEVPNPTQCKSDEFKSDLNDLKKNYSLLVEDKIPQSIRKQIYCPHINPKENILVRWFQCIVY